MKTFRLVIEFHNAPDQMDMGSVKNMALECIKQMPTHQAVEDEGEYTFRLTDIVAEAGWKQ